MSIEISVKYYFFQCDKQKLKTWKIKFTHFYEEGPPFTTVKNPEMTPMMMIIIMAVALILGTPNSACNFHPCKVLCKIARIRRNVFHECVLSLPNVRKQRADDVPCLFIVEFCSGMHFIFIYIFWICICLYSISY